MNIIICGVGGQGSLLTSKLLGKLYMNRGMDVKVSEVHGMSQRGGSVITYVRAGEKVAWPLIEQGEVDVMIALEALEALRWAHHVKPGGAIAVNTQQINPMPVLTGAAQYPQGLASLANNNRQVVTLDALSIARELGNIRCANVVLLGAAAQLLDFTEQEWQAVLNGLPEKLRAINIKAFQKGQQATQ